MTSCCHGHCHITNLVPGFFKAWARGRGEEAGRLPLLRLRGVLVSHCFISCAGALARDRPCQLPGARALAGISSSYSALSLLPAQTCPNPWRNISSACRTKYTHFKLWFEQNHSFAPGNQHFGFCCSDSLLISISLNMHDSRGSCSCNLLIRIK